MKTKGAVYLRAPPRLPASSAAVSELLADGVVLCHFLNSVKSRTVHTISVPSPAQPRLSAAKARRNVEAFMDGARRLGLTDTHLCDALDVLQPDTNANVSLARVARTVMRIQTRSRDGLMLGSLMKSVASRATASSSSLVSNGSAPAFQVGVDSDGEPASSMYSTPPRNYAPPANANHSGWLPATSTPTSGAGQSPYAQPSANANPNANPNRNLTPSDVSGQPNTAEGELNGAMYSSVAMRTVNQPRTMTPKSLRRDSTPVVSLPNFV